MHTDKKEPEAKTAPGQNRGEKAPTKSHIARRGATHTPHGATYRHESATRVATRAQRCVCQQKRPCVPCLPIASRVGPVWEVLVDRHFLGHGFE